MVFVPVPVAGASGRSAAPLPWILAATGAPASGLASKSPWLSKDGGALGKFA
jgi:hypothetical protein